jgi:hypothetical protein
MTEINSLEELRKELEEKGIIKPKEKTKEELLHDKHLKWKNELPPEQKKEFEELFEN